MGSDDFERTIQSLSSRLTVLLRYALGELKRIPAYAASDKAFCVLPADWDAVGPAFTKAVEAHAAAEPAACCS